MTPQYTLAGLLPATTESRVHLDPATLGLRRRIALWMIRVMVGRGSGPLVGAAYSKKLSFEGVEA